VSLGILVVGYLWWLREGFRFS